MPYHEHRQPRPRRYRIKQGYPEAAIPLNADAWLEINRALLRKRLYRPEANSIDSILGEMRGIAAPLAR